MAANLSELQQRLAQAHNQLEEIRTRWQQQRTILTILEDELIASKEVVLVLSEEIRVATEQQDFDSIIDQARLKDIASFKQRLRAK